MRALLALVRIRRVLRFYHWHEAHYLSPAFISGAAYAALCLRSADKHHPARDDLKRVALSLRDIPKLVAAPQPSDLGVALAAIASLKSHLQTCGQLTPFTGIARWSATGSPTVSPRAPWIADGANAPLEHLAWQLVAISHAAPPLVLFSRSPSLEYFRDAGVLTLRWFGVRHQRTEHSMTIAHGSVLLLVSAHPDAAQVLGPADAYVARILNLVGTHAHAIHAMLTVSRVEWSREVATACVECQDRPRLLLNPDFVKRWCHTPD